MAGLMAAPMALLELVLMRAMYPNRKLNALILCASAVAGIAFWLGIRQQAGIADRQFLRSMIPHHGAAILMCRSASIQDREIEHLCANIFAGQQAEIDQMQARLEELGAG